MGHCLSKALFVHICGILLCIPTFGLDRDRAITQFHHTAWTAKDGAPSQTSALAQTEDGYLWIGSERGLFRFDGEQFEIYAPPDGGELPSQNITSLMATPDGGLWISFAPTGIGFLKDGAIVIFSQHEEVYCFARDFDGRIWAGTQTGLIVFDGSQWHGIGTARNYTDHRVWSMFVDRNGTLWVAADDTIVFLEKGSELFQKTGVRTGGVPDIEQSDDGRLWITEYSKSLRPLSLPDGDSASDDPEISVPAIKFLFDREGSLWLTVKGEGIRRVRFPERLGSRKIDAANTEMESFKEQDGLTDNTATNLLEDREGNIWVSTNKGLERFRHSHLVPVALPTGYRDLTLRPGQNGTVWAGSAALKPVLLISVENILSKSSPIEIASVNSGAGDVVWWGGHGGIWRQRNEQFDFFPQPKGLTFNDLDWMWEVMPNSSGNGLWVGLGDVGLISFKNEIWTDHAKPSGLFERVPSASFQDSGGRIWLGYTGNRIIMVDGDRIQHYTSDDGIDIGRIRVIRGSGSRFWFGGDLGLTLFDNGRFVTVRTLGGTKFGTISGIVETPDGALWLNELRGVVRIAPEEIRQVAGNSDHPVSYQVFDFADGLPGGPQMNFRSSTAIAGTDGRLWFATDNGLVWIDPARISKNTLPPPVLIRSLFTDEMKYDPGVPFMLPPGTTAFRIDYTALSLSIPERVRFRYKLEGTGEDWQEAGSRRQAVYNNLGQGEYRFHVIASNNDGVWNNTGAILNFSIAPAWYETGLFRFVVFITLVLIVLVLYRLRVRQIAGAINARFDERLAERTRLAQELHDTFLQTIQGSKMVADDALEQNGDPVRLRRAMEQLSTWLGQAVDEGRAALNSLRTSTTETNDLAEALQRATDTCVVQGSMVPAFSVVGESRDMHPIVRDEIYRIGYEAIRNACAHSEASRMEVELTYDHDLIVRVKDNGKGIDPVIASDGKEGHFGIKGMRERATRIGAKFILESSASSGTEITLIVPGEIAFRTSIHSTES
ncbi:MAG: ATPase [Saprospiraceae bacterium]|nr:ATPase [Pyrinomonadaceae bacterium]